MGGAKGISFGDPITTWDYLPNGIGKDVFYVANDGHLYLEVKDDGRKKKVKLPESGVLTSSMTEPATIAWVEDPKPTRQSQQLRASTTQKYAQMPPLIMKTEGQPPCAWPKQYLYASDVNQDGMPDIDTDGLYNTEIIQTGTLTQHIKNRDGKPTDRDITTTGSDVAANYNTYQLKDFIEGGTLYYKIGGQSGQAIVLHSNGQQEILKPTVALVNGRMIMTITSENIKAPTNGDAKDVGDAIEISWNPTPKWSPTPPDGNYLDVKISSYHDGAALDGQALLATQNAPVDQDGDGVPDPVISVETTPHPYKNKTQEYPDGLDHSKTIEERIRVGVAHSVIGTQIE
jgi:hypothetical protein